MYKRIIVAIAGALFTLLALLAVIITDLHDQNFPLAIGAENKLTLDFSESDFSINEAFKELEELDVRWNLGLVKIAPDLASDEDRQVFVSLNDRNFTDEFAWFNSNNTGKVVGKDRLANSYPDGNYLVTGTNNHLKEFVDTLTSGGVQVTQKDASIFMSLGFVVWERGFATAVIAAFALIVTLALFWLSLKARGRALRVLNGSPTIRIQMQDLTGFGVLLLISAVSVALVAAIYVGVFHGWMYISTFLKALISLQVIVIIMSLLAALIMSATAWPSATMLATKQPAVKSLRSAAIIVQVLTFLLVVTSAGPAWSAYKHSSATAAEMAQWKQLADQVAIEFATDLDEMDRMESKIGKLVKDTVSQDMVSLSYTLTREMEGVGDFGKYSAVSFVNQSWINMVTTDAPNPAISIVPDNSIPEDIIQMIKENFEIWSRDDFSKDLFSQFQFLHPVDEFRIPLALGGGGEKLHFTDDVLLILVPSIYEAYDDSSLTSMISGKNVIFTNASATQQLLEEHGLGIEELRNQGFKGELNVVYIAENGILQAQFAAYIAWLQNLSLVALVIAFTVASAISALITALLQAKRDFPLRLAGRSWSRILQVRVTRELLVGIGLVAVVIVFQRHDAIGAVLVAAAYGVLVLPLSHLFVTRWCFNSVSKRKI